VSRGAGTRTYPGGVAHDANGGPDLGGDLASTLQEDIVDSGLLRWASDEELGAGEPAGRRLTSSAFASVRPAIPPPTTTARNWPPFAMFMVDELVSFADK